MKISYQWVNDLIEIGLDADALAEKLTLIGLELDGRDRFLDDHIFDIEVTSNRGDCLSHLGVAREISAFSDRDVNLPAARNDLPESTSVGLVSIDAPDLCPRFTARLLKNVKIGPSPDWLVRRLESIGERSINNVADVTNFVMHELGQPMHAFDFDKLDGNSIIVRKANPKEKLVTLDEIERPLDPAMLVICDTDKPVAVAGVMGGIDTGITYETTNVLLEVAYFDRDSIRNTSRELNLSTEASYHFERGVDLENLVFASNRATELICQLTGCSAEDFVDVYPQRLTPAEIPAPNLQEEVLRLSGLSVGNDDILKILDRLGLKQKSKGVFVSPSWRHDLAIEEDLVEEVVRITGYDNVGYELPHATSPGEYHPFERRKRDVRKTLANLGFDEALSYSFIAARHDESFEPVPRLLDTNLTEQFVSVRDPIIEGSTRMRPTLISGLLDALKNNFNHQNRDVKLFEIGKVFARTSKENGLPTERELMGIVITGDETFENTAFTSRAYDFRDLKGSLEASISAITSQPLKFDAGHVRHLKRGQAAKIVFDETEIGFLGTLSDEITAKFKFRQPVFVAEIDIQTVLEAAEIPAGYRPLPVFPQVTRDVSMLIKRNVSFDDIKGEIEKMGFELCRNIAFVDVFEGKGMADDERSITIRLDYRSDDRTLTEEEVEKIHQSILAALKVNLNIKQR